MSNIRYASIGERRGTGNVKWDLQGPLPFGVADMDIQSPPCLIAALRDRVAHPYYGYAYMTDSLRSAILDYLREHHRIEAQPEWIIDLPGCVPAFTLVARAICGTTESGLRNSAELMLCTPAYPPMLHCHEDAGCQIITVPMLHSGGHTCFDWDAMEKAVRPSTRLFLLCNPHNPLGRCCTPEELQKLGEFCCRHHLILCSDEIHCDLVLDPKAQHTSALTLPPEIQQRTIMLSAPSKTFNMAGIGFTFMAVPNPDLRKRILQTRGHSLPPINVFAYAAAEACYRHGWEWQRELVAALWINCQTAQNFIAEHMPMLRTQQHQATYLLWIDCSALQLDSPHCFFREHAGVYLDDGRNFGAPQCVRLNFACSPQMLLQGLQAMAASVASLKKI